MKWGLEEVSHPLNFRNPSEVQHDDPIAHMADHREIVRDDQVTQGERLFQFFQEVQDLPADGYVEGGDRLIANQQGGPRGQCPRDCNSLALSPTQLMRVSIQEMPRFQSDPGKSLLHP
jgi:hypothetical protein